jgi:hypothetical protein
MSFLALPPEPDNESAVVNDGWWPNIDLTALRKSGRLDGTVTAERLRPAVQMAVVGVNAELAAWKATQVLAGAANLAAVAAGSVDGIKVTEILYLRAISCAVQADLLERYHDVRPPGSNTRDALIDPRIDDMRRDMRWAISDLLGLRRSTVELI